MVLDRMPRQAVKPTQVEDCACLGIYRESLYWRLVLLLIAPKHASCSIKAETAGQTARGTLAAVFEKLGYGFEHATWRNSYLTMTLELRFKDPSAPKKSFSPPLNRLGSVERCLDGL